MSVRSRAVFPLLRPVPRHHELYLFLLRSDLLPLRRKLATQLGVGAAEQLGLDLGLDALLHRVEDEIPDEVVYKGVDVVVLAAAAAAGGEAGEW